MAVDGDIRFEPIGRWNPSALSQLTVQIHVPKLVSRAGLCR